VIAEVPHAEAQLGDFNTLPDAPSARLQEDGRVGPSRSDANNNPGTVKDDPESSKQTKRILYIIPNFRNYQRWITSVAIDDGTLSSKGFGLTSTANLPSERLNC
jgi:hypothetical protein